MLPPLEKAFFDALDEKQKRLYAGLRASTRGYYGVAEVALELNLHPHTVRAGQKQLAELEQGILAPSSRVRGEGGGRKKKSPSTPN